MLRLKYILIILSFCFFTASCSNNAQPENADNILLNENMTEENYISDVIEPELHAEQVLPEIFVSMTDDIWNSANMELSSFSNKDEFLARTEYYISAISEFTSREDKKYEIEFRLIDGVSWASGKIIDLNKKFFERDCAPIAHEITHIICPNINSTSLSEGFAEYCQLIFGKNPAVQSYGLDADIWANMIFAYQAENFDTLFPDIGAAGKKDTFVYNELRQYYYILSGSFVKYLIDNYGIDSFMQLYESGSLKNAYNNIYGKSFDDIKAEWRQYIENYPDPISLEDFQAYMYEVFTAHNLFE